MFTEVSELEEPTIFIHILLWSDCKRDNFVDFATY